MTKNKSDEQEIMKTYFAEAKHEFVTKDWVALKKRGVVLSKELFHQTAGIDKGQRSKQWIFWLCVSVTLLIATLTGQWGGGGWLTFILISAYTFYLYRGGRFVLKPKGLGYLLYLAPILILISAFNNPQKDNITQNTNTNNTNTSGSASQEDTSSYTPEPEVEDISGFASVETSAGVLISMSNTDVLTTQGFSGGYFETFKKGIGLCQSNVAGFDFDAVNFSRAKSQFSPKMNGHDVRMRVYMETDNGISKASSIGKDFIAQIEQREDSQLLFQMYDTSDKLICELGKIGPEQ